MIGNLAKKIFGSANDRRLKTYQPKVKAINALEPEVAALSDEQLRARTQEFRDQIAAGASLDDLIVWTVRTRTGEYFPPCANCSTWLPGSKP